VRHSLTSFNTYATPFNDHYPFEQCADIPQSSTHYSHISFE
jgi:hypothetical protein